MNYQQLLQGVVGTTLVMLLLVGCGAPVPPTPRTGHWEGNGNPYVSFDVTADSSIRDLELIDAPRGLGGSYECTLKSEETAIEADGTFAITTELVWEDEKFTNRIEGKFDDDTTVTGSYVTEFCVTGDEVSVTTYSVGDTSKPWSAVWKSP